MMVKESSVNNNLVYRSSRVGVPRHTTPNGAFKPLFVGCAQIRKPYKKPAKPFQNWLRGLLHVWRSRGGQNRRWFRRSRQQKAGGPFLIDWLMSNYARWRKVASESLSGQNLFWMAIPWIGEMSIWQLCLQKARGVCFFTGSMGFCQCIIKEKLHKK